MLTLAGHQFQDIILNAEGHVISVSGRRIENTWRLTPARNRIEVMGVRSTLETISLSVWHPAWKPISREKTSTLL
jgi:glutathionylspermidine synthase